MKKKISWRKQYWDKWTFGRKVLHVLSVIGSMIAIISMWLVAAYVVLIVFGVYGFLLKFRDTVLLEFAHWLFG